MSYWIIEVTEDSTRARNNAATQLMKGVVVKVTDADVVDMAAYAASRPL